MLVSQSRRIRKWANWRLGCEAHLCIPASPVSWFWKCHLPRWQSEVVVYFFQLPFRTCSASHFQQWALCGTSLFSLSHRIQTPSQFSWLLDQSTTHPRLQSALLCISAKSVLSLFCLIFSIFSYSSYPWVYLGILGYVIILSVTAVCLEQRRYIKHEFFLIPGHSSLPNQVFMSSGY